MDLIWFLERTNLIIPLCIMFLSPINITKQLLYFCSSFQLTKSFKNMWLYRVFSKPFDILLWPALFCGDKTFWRLNAFCRTMFHCVCQVNKKNMYSRKILRRLLVKKRKNDLSSQDKIRFLIRIKNALLWNEPR